jgi:Spy/CpxP family protein refolding chaperone
MMQAPLLKIVRGRRPLAAFTWLLVALSLFVLIPQARAQQQQQQQDAEPSRQEGVQPQGGGRGNNLMQQLNLTPEQRVQLREIRRQSEPETRELTRRMRLARRALEEAIYSDADNEALIEQRARALADAQAALVRLRAMTELKVRRVLTPEQLQSFRNLRLQAQRRQMLQRRLRGAGQQTPPPGALEQNPQGANPPAGAPRDLRPANTPRVRQRRRLDKP